VLVVATAPPTGGLVLPLLLSTLLLPNRAGQPSGAPPLFVTPVLRIRIRSDPAVFNMAFVTGFGIYEIGISLTFSLLASIKNTSTPKYMYVNFSHKVLQAIFPRFLIF
jgi:hypothetical protein